jgi:hypothetical protein
MLSKYVSGPGSKAKTEIEWAVLDHVLLPDSAVFRQHRPHFQRPAARVGTDISGPLFEHCDLTHVPDVK